MWHISMYSRILGRPISCVRCGVFVRSVWGKVMVSGCCVVSMTLFKHLVCPFGFKCCRWWLSTEFVSVLINCHGVFEVTCALEPFDTSEVGVSEAHAVVESW